METKILKLHKEGLSNRQIAKLLNLKGHYLIKPILDKHKLKANGGVRRNEPLLIKGVDALCQSCNEFKSIKSFRVNRKGKPDEYRLKSCNKCNWKKRNIYLNNNINAYLQDRIISIKTKRGELGFDIDLEYISNLYEKQKGKCVVCKEEFKLSEMEADHIKPWHEGGKTIEKNCQLLCKDDNRRKSGK